jgi:hypothetical protein
MYNGTCLKINISKVHVKEKEMRPASESVVFDNILGR